MEKYIHLNWLKQTLSDLRNDGEIDQSTAEKIQSSAEARNEHGLYKFFKRYLGLIGGYLTVIGLLIIIGDMFFDREKLFQEDGLKKFFKIMSLIPAAIGGGLYYLYLSQFRKSKLWKEILLPLFFICVAISLPSALYAFEIDFINNKIIFFMILSLGLFLIYKHNSSVTACVYLFFMLYVVALMGGTALAAAGPREVEFFTRVIGDKYPWLLQLTWLFLAALVPFLKIQLEKAKGVIGIKEAILGGLFVGAAVQNGMALSGGYPTLGLMVILPLMYLLSKRYYAKGTWFFYRPGSTNLVFMAIYMTIIMANKSGMKMMLYSGFKLSKKFYFSTATGLLFIIIIGALTYLFYKKEIEAKNIKINYFLLAFPAVLFLASLVGSDIGYILFTAYGFALAWFYVQEGLKMRFAPLIIIGSILGIVLVIEKIIANVGDKLVKDPSLSMVGILLMFFGLVMVGIVQYVKQQWSVSDDTADDGNENLLDDAIGSVSSISVDDIKSSITEITDDISDSVGGGNDSSSETNETPAQEPPSTESKPEEPKNDSQDKPDSDTPNDTQDGTPDDTPKV